MSSENSLARRLAGSQETGLVIVVALVVVLLTVLAGSHFALYAFK